MGSAQSTTPKEAKILEILKSPDVELTTAELDFILAYLGEQVRLNMGKETDNKTSFSEIFKLFVRLMEGNPTFYRSPELKASLRGLGLHNNFPNLFSQ